MSADSEAVDGCEVIARQLGISVEDVDSYATWFHNPDDPQFPIGIVVVFDPATPLSIRQAAGAGDLFTVGLGIHLFDE